MEIQANSIKKEAGKIKDFISDLESEYKKINTTVEELKKGWKGNKADEFYKKMDGVYLPDLKKSIEELKKYYDFLSNVPKAYETFDESYKNKKIEV